MSAHTILVCNITPGRETEARSVLRDYSAFLEGHGAQETIYRNLFAGEQSGRLLVYAAAESTAARAAFLDKVLADGSNNPYQKAIASSDPPISGWGRTMVRTLDPGIPMLPQSRLRIVRVMSAPFGRRAEVQDAFAGARRRLEGLGVTAAGYLIETGVASNDPFAWSLAVDSMAAWEDFERRNAALTPAGPLATALTGGLLTPVGRRVDIRFDV